MNIDKFKEKDNQYYKDGIYYEDAETFIYSSIFNFCGCGCPNKALLHIYSSLQLIDDLTNLVYKKIITFEEWKKRKKDIFANDGVEYFMWYFLDNNNLVEHGSCLPGWLTKKGKELLSDLKELYNISNINQTTNL